MTVNFIPRNDCLIEAIQVQSGKPIIVAKAVRADVRSSWHVGVLIDGKMIQIAEIFNHVTENRLRKYVLNFLKGIV